MSENKTKPNLQNIEEFLDNYPNQKVIPDCKKLVKIFQSTSKFDPVIWAHMVGFGKYHYKYASGREGDAMIAGFAPSKAGITLYLPCVYAGVIDNLDDLGKFKKGGGCLYIKKLEDINIDVLKKLIKQTIKWTEVTYPKNK